MKTTLMKKLEAGSPLRKTRGVKTACLLLSLASALICAADEALFDCDVKVSKTDAKAEVHDPKAGRTLVWGDEFDGDKLDLTKWNFRQTMNNNKSVYDNGPNCLRVEDGCLKMIVKPTGDKDKPWTLPQGVTSHDGMAFRYGYIEIRARLPYRHGSWPSFWTQSTDCLQKAKYMAEIDIFEAGSTNSFGSCLHKWIISTPMRHEMLTKGGGGHVFEKCDNLPNEFHVYGLEWSPSAVSCYIDGKRYWTRPIDNAHDFGGSLPGMEGFHDYQFIIFNNELFTTGIEWVKPEQAAHADDPKPRHYWIDWVRLYQNSQTESLCVNPAKQQNKKNETEE